MDVARRGGAELVVVDTSSLISGVYGQILKYHKMEVTRPEYVIGFERGEELDPLLGIARRFTPAPGRGLPGPPRGPAHHRRRARRDPPGPVRGLLLRQPAPLAGQADGVPALAAPRGRRGRPGRLLVGMEDGKLLRVGIGYLELAEDGSLRMISTVSEGRGRCASAPPASPPTGPRPPGSTSATCSAPSSRRGPRRPGGPWRVRLAPAGADRPRDRLGRGRRRGRRRVGPACRCSWARRRCGPGCRRPGWPRRSGAGRRAGRPGRRRHRGPGAVRVRPPGPRAVDAAAARPGRRRARPAGLEVAPCRGAGRGGAVRADQRRGIHRRHHHLEAWHHPPAGGRPARPRPDPAAGPPRRPAGGHRHRRRRRRGPERRRRRGPGHGPPPGRRHPADRWPAWPPPPTFPPSSPAARRATPTAPSASPTSAPAPSGGARRPGPAERGGATMPGMAGYDWITFTSDYGLEDHFVGVATG